MSTSPTDASIPVLTQIIGSPMPAGAAKVASAAPATSAAVVSAPAPAAEGAVARTDEEWRALELKLNERVLRQVLRRVDFVMEHRVKETLAEVLEKSTGEMMKEIRRGLHETLEDVIRRAVVQEMARVQAVKDKD